jgi:hypothetical protein
MGLIRKLWLDMSATAIRRRWILWGACLLAGALFLPVAAYIIGGRMIGPYEGPRGMASYLGAIYGDVGRGQPLALILVFGPAACLAAWSLRGWLTRRLTPPADAD